MHYISSVFKGVRAIRNFATQRFLRLFALVALTCKGFFILYHYDKSK